jgi:hypothetical protein
MRIRRIANASTNLILRAQNGAKEYIATERCRGCQELGVLIGGRTRLRIRTEDEYRGLPSRRLSCSTTLHRCVVESK